MYTNLETLHIPFTLQADVFELLQYALMFSTAVLTLATTPLMQVLVGVRDSHLAAHLCQFFPT